MVEGTRLESVRTQSGTGGPNPPLSANNELHELSAKRVRAFRFIRLFRTMLKDQRLKAEAGFSDRLEKPKTQQPRQIYKVTLNNLIINHQPLREQYPEAVLYVSD